MEMSTQEVQGDIKNIAKLSLSNTEAALAVSRLPPEILCQIFLCYRSLEPSQFTIRVNGEASIGGEQSSSHGDEERGWINITYICSRWREIAIGYPALWDCVGPFIPAQWQDEILRRSSQHPLSITLEVNRLDRTELNGLIDKALPRLRHLSLDWVDTALDYNANQRLPLTGNQFSEFLDQFSTASICAPVLDSLSLCYPVDCQTVNLSAASLPALRSLDLTCFGVEPTCSGLNNITDLTIDTYRMTTEELYIALQHMPKLEDLYATLRYVGGFGDFLPPEYLPVALPMPHLKSLQVKAFHPECFELFRHLDIPADSYVRLFMDSVDRRDLALLDIESLGGPSRPPRSLSILTDSLAAVHLSLSPGISLAGWEWRSQMGVQEGRTSLRVRYLLWSIMPPPLSNGTALWSGLYLVELTHLSVQLSLDHIWTRHRWLANFRRARKVTTILVRGPRATLSLLSALAPPVIGSDVLPPSAIPDAALAPFILPESGSQSLLNDDPGSGGPWSGEEHDVLLFPCLETIVVEAINDTVLLPVAAYDFWKGRTNPAAILHALAEGLEVRRSGGARPMKLVEIPYFDKNRDQVASIVDRLKQGAGVECVEVSGEQNGERY